MTESVQGKVVEASGLSLLTLGGSVLIVLVATPYYYDGLGEQAYGVVGLLESFFVILRLVNLGASEATVRFLARPLQEGRHDEVRRLSGTLSTWFLAAGLLGFVLCVTGGSWGLAALLKVPPAEADTLHTSLLAAASFWLLQFLALHLFNLLRARFDYRRLMVYQLAVSLALPGASLVGLAVGGDLAGFLWGRALVYLAATLAWLLLEPRGATPLPVRPRLDLGWLRGMLIFSAGSALLHFGGVLHNSVDRLLLAELGGARLAAYTVIATLSLRAYVVLQTAAGVLFPAMAQLDQPAERQLAWELFELATRATALIGVAIYVPLAAFGRGFLAAWVAPEVAEYGAGALTLLCAARLLGGSATVAFYSLLGFGHAVQCACISLGCGLLGVGVMVAAIPAHGLMGAALGVLAGSAALHLGLLAAAQRRIRTRVSLPQLGELLLLLGAGLVAYHLLALAAATLDSPALGVMLGVLAAAAAALFGLGLLADWLAARALGRRSVVGLLAELPRRLRPGRGT